MPTSSHAGLTRSNKRSRLFSSPCGRRQEVSRQQLGDLARPYLPHALIVPLDVCLPG
jgi:hypothetical protein